MVKLFVMAQRGSDAVSELELGSQAVPSKCCMNRDLAPACTFGERAGFDAGIIQTVAANRWPHLKL